MKYILCSLLFMLSFRANSAPVPLDIQMHIDFGVNSSLSQSLTHIRFQNVFSSKRGKIVLKRFYNVTCVNINCRILSFDITTKRMGHSDFITKDYLIKNATFVEKIALVMLDDLELKVNTESLHFLITENVKNIKYEWVSDESSLM